MRNDLKDPRVWLGVVLIILFTLTCAIGPYALLP